MSRVYENHAADSRVKDCGQCSPTVTRKWGYGRWKCPICPNGGEMKRSFKCVMDMQGGKPGCHFSREQVCPTITKGRASVNDIHLLCYIIDPIASNSMKSSNPHSGFHREERAMTLYTTTPCPQKGQGGLVIVEVKK